MQSMQNLLGRSSWGGGSKYKIYKYAKYAKKNAKYAKLTRSE